MSLLFLLLTIGAIIWCLWYRPVPHWSYDLTWRRELKQWRRDKRRTDWAAVRQACRTELWHPGDAVPVLRLLALAAGVIAVCR